MAPVKKQRNVKKLTETNETEKKLKNINESVVSGQLQKKINKKQNNPQKVAKGVVFIKHLPHGFFEEQLQKYFEQFGGVTRIRLARSTLTGSSKGYAYIEFEYPEVAKIAAETMNNYLMFKKIVKAVYIPPEKQNFNYFRTSVKKIRNKSGKTMWVSRRTASILRKVKIQNDWSEENYNKRIQKQIKKLKKVEEKCRHLDININDVIVEPKMQTEKEKIIEKKMKVKSSAKEKSTDSSKVVKRTILKTDDSSNKPSSSKKSKIDLSLEDLLGNTIQDDSDDEDYKVSNDSESNTEEYDISSDDEFGKDLDGNNYEEQESVESANSPIVVKKSKQNFVKSKVSNVERFNEIVKRKPHTGGISKLKKKPFKQQSVISKSKTALKVTAAKELAKPLSKVKGNLKRPLKTKKNLIKIK